MTWLQERSFLVCTVYLMYSGYLKQTVNAARIKEGRSFFQDLNRETHMKETFRKV
jgi:hypothetical protein